MHWRWGYWNENGGLPCLEQIFNYNENDVHTRFTWSATMAGQFFETRPGWPKAMMRASGPLFLHHLSPITGGQKRYKKNGFGWTKRARFVRQERNSFLWAPRGVGEFFFTEPAGFSKSKWMSGSSIQYLITFFM